LSEADARTSLMRLDAVFAPIRGEAAMKGEALFSPSDAPFTTCKLLRAEQVNAMGTIASHRNVVARLTEERCIERDILALMACDEVLYSINN
jgi:hypothetical protein